MLRGERMTLRAMERGDLPFLHALVNDLDTQWLVSEHPPVPCRWQRWKPSSIVPRGRGLGSDVGARCSTIASESVDMHKVALESLATNEAGLATWKSCGFVQEARLREHAW
jgi:hypothetical protein